MDKLLFGFTWKDGPGIYLCREGSALDSVHTQVNLVLQWTETFHHNLCLPYYFAWVPQAQSVTWWFCSGAFIAPAHSCCVSYWPLQSYLQCSAVHLCLQRKIHTSVWKGTQIRSFSYINRGGSSLMSLMLVCPRQGNENSHETCTAFPFSFGASHIGLKVLMRKEQHFIQGHRKRSCEEKVMICTMSNTKPWCSMPWTY